MDWTEEADNFLLEHRGKLSTLAIATALGCTKNAVAGRAFRLKLERLERVCGWERVNTPKRVKRRKRAARIVQVVSPPTPIIDTQIPFEQRKTLIELEPHHCRWPVGDPQSPDFFYCGADKCGDGPYCAAHHFVAYNYVRDEHPRKPTAAHRVFGLAA